MSLGSGCWNVIQLRKAHRRKVGTGFLDQAQAKHRPPIVILWPIWSGLSILMLTSCSTNSAARSSGERQYRLQQPETVGKTRGQ
jgi:hypothetical protein